MAAPMIAPGTIHQPAGHLRSLVTFTAPQMCAQRGQAALVDWWTQRHREEAVTLRLACAQGGARHVFEIG